MNEHDYTKRELEHLFEEVHQKLDRIETQVKSTNGRVSSLESWKSFMTGGLAVLSLMVVPILLYVITKGL